MPPPAMARGLYMELDQLRNAIRDIAHGIRRLVDGDLHAMFDGPTTAGIDLEAPVVAFDLSRIPSYTSLGVVMISIVVWLRRLLTEVDLDDPAAVALRRQIVYDEAWKVLRVPGVARFMVESWKMAGQWGVQNIAVMHRLSDPAAVGSEDSEEIRLARGLLSDSQTRVIYQQPTNEIQNLKELLLLNRSQAELVERLQPSQALWQVGRHNFLVQHRLGAAGGRAREDGQAPRSNLSMKIVVAGFGVVFCQALVPPLLFGSGSGATASGQASSSGSPMNKRAPGDLKPIWTDCGDARRTPPPCPDNFPSGECTWWAAYNRWVTWNGNGGEWLANAAAQGRTISPTSVVGSIAVYYSNVGYSQYGHVALVTAVSPTSFHVSEMNYVGHGVVSERDSPWPDPVHVEGFILGGVGDSRRATVPNRCYSEPVLTRELATSFAGLRAFSCRDPEFLVMLPRQRAPTIIPLCSAVGVAVSVSCAGTASGQTLVEEGWDVFAMPWFAPKTLSSGAWSSRH